MMKLNYCKNNGNKGFTLLEAIITLIVAGILGAMLVSFMGTSVMQSANPVIIAQNGSRLNAIMENITADYKYIMSTSSSPMTDFMAHIGDKKSQTYYSDLDHPYTVINNDRISFPDTGSSVSEIADPNGKVLKVTISYQGLTLTALFTE